MTSQFNAQTGPIVSLGLELERANLRALRTSIENELERLFSILDAIDGDPDLEPSFGTVMPGYVDEAESDADLEPSLGWTGTYAHGTDQDLEEEHDGREPDEDFEGNTDDNGIGDRGGLDEQYGIDATVARFVIVGTVERTYHTIPESY
ncbi:hypothetical protein FHR70_003740 [Microvirga lupini]|uniref:Uncharacterized protein n=1 Tax=Microvirga lupini TaxID=420324 RepID=A0A7W4VNX5_9HYPH|nr:hypothetical protein [Microvirga lupini]MBB3020654.1 hypothetical protein [Microvirga lupini]